MKIANYLKPLTALTCSGSLYALERPTPAAEPQEKNNIQEVIPMPQIEVDLANTAFLGVFGEPLPDALAEHLNLEKGAGIALKVIANNSPASKAGLRKHDIILSIDDKQIQSQNDLKETISQKKPGDTISINYLSKGEGNVVKVTLDSRNVPNQNQELGKKQQDQFPKARANQLALPKDFLNKFPKKDQERLMQLLQDNLEGLDLEKLKNGGMRNFKQFHFHNQPLDQLNLKKLQGQKMNGNFNSRMKVMDGRGSVSLESTKDGNTIELRDNDGKLQYRGPFNTDEEKQNIPKELQDRVENLNVRGGMKFLNLGKNNLMQLEKLGDLDMKLNEILPKEFQKELQLPNYLKDLLGGKLKNHPRIQKHTFKFRAQTESSSTLTDPQTGDSYTLEKSDGKKQVEIHDRGGNLLYNGPYNTDIDKASVPHEHRDFLEKMDARKGFNFKGKKLNLDF